VVLLLAAIAGGAMFFDSASWTRWDAGIYMSIADHGYTLTHCRVSPQYPPGSWCGSAGWFPGYPVLLAPLYSLGLPRVATAVFVSWVFDFAVLVLLWEGFLRRLNTPIRYVALVFAAFVPGGVYMHAAYPMSMAAFFMLLCLYLLYRESWLWASLAGAVATFCYLSALAIAPIVVVWILLATRGEDTTRRLTKAIGAGAVVCVGLLAALLLAQIQTGRWDAYFLVQANFHHGLHFPFTLLLPMLRGPFAGVTYVQGIWDTEAILATVLVLGLVIGIAVQARARLVTWQDMLVLGLVVICWLAPLSQWNISYWRTDTLLLPAALLLPRIPPGLAVVLTGAAVAVFPFLAIFFFNGTLV
jgi:Gpi18-like mannosyltransferase